MKLTAVFKSTSKINLYLDIVGKDPSDGYHYLESVFYEVAWGDDFEIFHSDKDKVVFTGLNSENIPEENTVSKSLRLFKEKYHIGDCFHITIKKNVPSGAGLGGGSGDAGALLRWLSVQYSVDPLDCIDIAYQVGSDVPFFLYGGMALVEGKGERIVPLDNQLEDVAVVLIYPCIHVSTQVAFNSLKSVNVHENKTLNFRSFLKKKIWTIDNLKNIVYNIFNENIREIDTELLGVRQELENILTPDIMSMTGSGSTFILLYKKSDRHRELEKIIDIIGQACKNMQIFIQ